MKLPSGIDPLLEPLQALHNVLMRFNQRGVVIGGIAVGLIGKPRYTEDLDAMFLLSTEELPMLLDVAAKEGIQPRIKDAIEFAQNSRVVLLKHVVSETPIDISLGILPFEEET